MDPAKELWRGSEGSPRAQPFNLLCRGCVLLKIMGRNFATPGQNKRPRKKQPRQDPLTSIDAEMKEKTENPSIGIIVCKDKKKTIVEYALKESKKPIAVSQYKITTKLPKELKKQLPSPEQIQRLIEQI